MSCCCVSQAKKAPPFPLSDTRNDPDPVSGLTPKLAPSMSLTIQPSPTVASPLTYQFALPPFMAGFRNYQPFYHHLLCLPLSLPLSFIHVLKRLRRQHKTQSSISHPPHRSTLSPSISLSTDTVSIPPLSQPPPPFLDRATQPPKEAPTSGWSRISTLASPSTQPYYSTRPPSPVPASLRSRAIVSHKS